MGKVVWFTGLSGSGKTTLSNTVKDELIEISNKSVFILDGDQVRNSLAKKLGFTRENIKKNNLSIAELAKKESKQYDFIFVSVIAPFNEDRKLVKKIIGNDMVLIFVKSSLNSCIRRDPKGLYKKALNNQIDNFIGISKNTPYEIPENADLIVDTEKYNILESTDYIVKFLL